MLTLGRLSYLNAAPFYLTRGLTLLTLPSPRAIGEGMKRGLIDAGPVPLVDTWEMEDIARPVGPFIIAVAQKARSVLLKSRRPLSDLEGQPIGLTTDSKTSVQLLKLLLHKRGVEAHLRPGFSHDDEARLIIGDAALRTDDLAHVFPWTMDLGEAWHQWQGLPFVFARWMVRREVPEGAQVNLAGALAQSLESFSAHKDIWVEEWARQWGLEKQAVGDYFQGLVFSENSLEQRAADRFRSLADRVPAGRAS